MKPDERKAAIYAALVDLLPKYGFDKVDPLLILSESRLETGNFTSDLVANVFNAFGMKYPLQRETTAWAETGAGYAAYKTLRESVEDYLMRQRAFHIPNTANAAEYIAATLNSHYAEDPAYGDKWADLYGTATPPDNVRSSSTPMLAGLGLLLLLLWPNK